MSNYVKEITLVATINLKEDGIIEGVVYSGLLCSDGSVDIDSTFGIVKLNEGEYLES